MTKILVVDDDYPSKTRSLLVNVLTRLCGYECIEASGIEEVKELKASGQLEGVDAVVLDSLEGGYKEAASFLKRACRIDAILLLSGNGEYLEEAERIPDVSGTLSKPARPDELKAKIEELINTGRNR